MCARTAADALEQYGFGGDRTHRPDEDERGGQGDDGEMSDPDQSIVDMIAERCPPRSRCAQG